MRLQTNEGGFAKIFAGSFFSIRIFYQSLLLISMKQYKTIQIDAELKDRLTKITQENGWPISVVVGRLIEHWLDGSLSGSLADVVRND